LARELFIANTPIVEIACAQLNLPQGIVWGSSEWVDSVREARRKYGKAMEGDFKLLKKMGVAFMARRRLGGEGTQEGMPVYSSFCSLLCSVKPKPLFYS
jgi:hypothetical protein